MTMVNYLIKAEGELVRINKALDELGVPRASDGNGPAPVGQPFDAECRVRWLGEEVGRLRSTARAATCDDSRRSKIQALAERATCSAAELEVEAVKIVQRTFGASIDLSAGTAGAAFVSMVVTDLKNEGELRDKLLALATTIRPPEAGE